MDKTICGHDRDVLIWALEHADATGDHHVSGDPMPYAIACGEVLDPAKLAEMMAARGRELGFNIINRLPHDESLPFADIYAVCECVSIATSILWQECIFGDVAKKLTMPQARAILLQWLQLPDGAREEAEKVLRGKV